MLARLEESAKWYWFAMSADDRRRERFSTLITRFRGRTVDARRSAARSLDDTEAPAIDARTGFVSLPPGTLESVDAVVSEARRVAAPYLETTAPWEGRQQMLSGLVDNAELGLASPFLEFALQERVIAIVSRYLGMVPILASVDVLVSRFFEQPLLESQLYHCDYEDVRQVKIFLHCSDVTAGDGPLTVVPADQSRAIKRKINYKYGRAGYRVPDDVMAEAHRDFDEVALTGAPGTAQFVDTSTCFHYGSRVTAGARRRIVAQYQFLTPAAFDLVFRYSSLPFAALTSGRGLSDVQRLVLGAS